LLRCTAAASRLLSIPAPCAHDLLYLCKITNLDCYFPFALLENNWFVNLDSLILRVFPILGFLESVAVFISCLPSAEEKEKKKNSFVTTSHRSPIHIFFLGSQSKRKHKLLQLHGGLGASWLKVGSIADCQGASY
jgi:hypothetical protein